VAELLLICLSVSCYMLEELLYSSVKAELIIILAICRDFCYQLRLYQV